jgi:hypothetical protein
MLFTLILLNILFAIYLFIYKFELKNRLVLFSSLLHLSVNTIPEDAEDYLFESSSDEMVNEKSEISISDSSSNNGEAADKFLLTKKSMLDLRLDLTPDNKISSTNSSALNEKIIDTRNAATQTENSIEVIDKGLK